MMFIILSYDVEQKRNAKVRKTVKKYLLPVQESVFEGIITESKLKKLKTELARIIDCACDSVVIYELASEKMIAKEKLGNAVTQNGFIL